MKLKIENYYQVATSGCRPSLSINTRSSKIDNNCQLSNEFALKEIERIKPTIIIMAQSNYHEEVDWEKIALVLREKGAKEIIIFGPVPQYKPSLPSIYVRKAWESNTEYIKTGLDTNIFMNEKYRKSNFLHYISPIDYLCNDEGCKVVLNRNNKDLMLVDYGHLSPNGSLLIGSFLFDELYKRNIFNDLN